MLWLEADNDVTLDFDYEVDGEFVVPDSATYIVRDHTGATLDTGSLPAINTSESLTVSAANNSTASDFENRFVSILFSYGGRTYQARSDYTIYAFAPVTVGVEDVRRELGLDPSELPDSEINIMSAYYHLVDLHGDNLSEAFTETGVRNLSANQAVAVYAALDIVGSLELRASISHRSEDSEFKRMIKLDFPRLREELNIKAAGLLEVAKGVTPSSVSLFELTTPTDAVTG